MKKLLVLMLALIVLVGCVQTEVKDEKEAREAAQEAEKPVGDKIVSAPSRVLSSELKQEIESKLIKGVKFSMPLNYRRMKHGDSFVFGVGVQNIKTKEYEFSVDVKFNKAYDRMMNSISTDEDTMNSWVETTIEPFNMLQNDKEILSVVLKVGDIRPGIKPTLGTYVFDVEAYFREFDNVVRDEYAKAQFSVKVD